MATVSFSPRPVLLDTCAALWLIDQSPFASGARSAIESAANSNLGVYASAFMAWEIGTLVARGRLQLHMAPEVWFHTLLAVPGVRLAPLTPGILLSSTALPGIPPKDPADRIVAATARAQGWAVITRDRKLLDYADQGHILAVEC